MAMTESRDRRPAIATRSPGSSPRASSVAASASDCSRERRERQRRLPLAHGDRVRIAGSASLEHRGHRLPRQRDRAGGVERGERLAFVLHEDVHRGDRAVGILDHGVEQRLEVTRDCGAAVAARSPHR